MMNSEARNQLLKFFIMLRKGLRSVVFAMKVVVYQVVRHIHPNQKPLLFRDVFGDSYQA